MPPAQAYEHNFENRTLFYRFHLDAVGPAPDGAGPSTSWCDALCESLCVPVIAPTPSSHPDPKSSPNPNPNPYPYPTSTLTLALAPTLTVTLTRTLAFLLPAPHIVLTMLNVVARLGCKCLSTWRATHLFIGRVRRDWDGCTCRDVYKCSAAREVYPDRCCPACRGLRSVETGEGFTLAGEVSRLQRRLRELSGELELQQGVDALLHVGSAALERRQRVIAQRLLAVRPHPAVLSLPGQCKSCPAACTAGLTLAVAGNMERRGILHELTDGKLLACRPSTSSTQQMFASQQRLR